MYTFYTVLSISREDRVSHGNMHIPYIPVTDLEGVPWPATLALSLFVQYLKINFSKIKIPDPKSLKDFAISGMPFLFLG
jgi:hypothetical protein